VVSEIIYFLRTQDQSKLPVVLNAPWNKADSIDHYPQQDAGKTRKACELFERTVRQVVPEASWTPSQELLGWYNSKFGSGKNPIERHLNFQKYKEVLFGLSILSDNETKFLIKHIANPREFYDKLKSQAGSQPTPLNPESTVCILKQEDLCTQPASFGEKVKKLSIASFLKVAAFYSQLLDVMTRDPKKEMEELKTLMSNLILEIRSAKIFSEMSPLITSNPSELVDSLPGTSRIYDNKGTKLYEFYPAGKRLVLDLGKLKYRQPEKYKTLLDSLLVREDKNFFDHDGIDIKALSRAVYERVFHSSEQGGSTITQQLIKNLIAFHYKGEYSQSDRKASEVGLALVLEATLREKFGSDKVKAKEFILETYLNTASFSFGSRGFETAAHDYFNKTTEDLTIEEIIFLVGCTNDPHGTYPFKESGYKNAIFYYHDTIHKLKTEGKISSERAISLKANSPVAKAPDQPEYNEVYGYIAGLVKNSNPEKFNSGVEIHTTLDPEVQAILDIQFKDDEKGVVRTAVIRGPRGEILASRGNIFSQEVQPGSTIKPLIYATAVTAGFKPSQFDDSAYSISTSDGTVADIYSLGREGWSISNVKDAFKYSTNPSFARMARDYQPELSRVWSNAGVYSHTAFPNPPDLIALGVNQLSTVANSQTAQVMGTGGVYPLKVISTIESNKVKHYSSPESRLKPVISELASNQLTNVLLRKGDLLYKTGTTDHPNGEDGMVGNTAALVYDKKTGRTMSLFSTQIDGKPIPSMTVERKFNSLGSALQIMEKI
ncbi:penicillin-binding protein, partial [Candidatus Amesbacteria bacterium]|nr:penicillin-binding protein [Candidatus Amesbacteria bacterium]